MWNHTPLKDFQAAFPVNEPIDQLSRAKQQTAWRMVAEQIDNAWKRYEQPQINRTLEGQKVLQVETSFPVLSEPAKRRTEVFAYREGSKQWWHTGSIVRGRTHCKVHFGAAHTKAGAKFRMKAVTTNQSVHGMMPPPTDRTQSNSVTLIRK